MPTNTTDDVFPLLMIFHHFIFILSQMRSVGELEGPCEAFEVILLMNQFVNFLSSIRPLSVNVPLLLRIRPCSDITNGIWTGRDVFSALANRRGQFWFITGETPETFVNLLNSLLPRFDAMRNKSSLLNHKNRLLLTLIWLRKYPTYDVLSAMFDVSPDYISRNIEKTWVVLWHHFSNEIKWPSQREWLQKRGEWPEMPNVIGVIDGTSHEILVPQEEQQLFYSGHRHFHCMHTQIIICSNKEIVYIHSGFLGHQNDATTYRQCANIGPTPNHDLPFPPNARLLADSIYPCAYPLITPYKINSIVNQSVHERRRRRRYNKVLRHRRVYVEHVIKEVKTFLCKSSIYRRQIVYLPSLIELCAVLSKRRVDFLFSV